MPSLSLKKYDSGIHPTLCYYMALAGLTLEQIAGELGITDRTLDNWVRAHPELKDAMRPGKDFIDNLVEGSLLKRALGYDFVEVTRERMMDEGTKRPRMVVTKRVTKHIPGEVGAECFWLKNRKGWRDRIDITGHIDHRQDLSNLTDEELIAYRAMAAKLEAPVAGRN